MNIEDMTVKEFDEYWAHPDNAWNSPEAKRIREECNAEYEKKYKEVYGERQ